MTWQPVYLSSLESGALRETADELYSHYRACDLCPRSCGVDRTGEGRGVCGAGAVLKVSSAHPHFGEEAPLVGRSGSGTIFFSHCGLRCLYCQNWEISHEGRGSPLEEAELARLMLGLQERGCHNINLVTPTHYLPGILGALELAAREGLRLPVVYNTSGYESVEMLQRLEGVVDIYLPDVKYAEPAFAAAYSAGAVDYPERVETALEEMFRQVGLLQTDPSGVARRGLLIRHLVLPRGIAGSERLVRFVAERLDPRVTLNIMAQYRPCYRASGYPELSRGITAEEYARVLALAESQGLCHIEC